MGGVYMPRFAKAFIIGIATLFVLLIAWSIVVFVPVKSTIDKTYSGYQITVADPEADPQPCEIILQLEYTNYLADFISISPEANDSIRGNVILPEPYKTSLEGYSIPISAIVHEQAMLWYVKHDAWKSNSYIAGSMHMRNKFETIVITLCDLTEDSTTFNGQVIIAPAANLDEALAIYSDYYETQELEYLAPLGPTAS